MTQEGNISAYMAGVADSDGSFTISKHKVDSTRRKFTYVGIFQLSWKKSNESLAAMKSLKKTFGGYISDCKAYRTTFGSKPEVYKYSISGADLDNFLYMIIPHLKLKTRQARALLNLRRLPRYFGAKGKSLSIYNKEDKLFNLVRSLNTKNGH